MKILSIDLDYCMSPSIQLYNNAFFDNNPLTRWNDLFNNTDFKENHLVIDQSNLLFCFDTFLKSLKYCDSVSFVYEHDAILFNIENFDNIELINIDHHDDVLGGSYITDSVYNPEGALSKEYFDLCENGRVNESNWVSWLANQKILKSYTWICNQNSNKSKNFVIERIISEYVNVEKENYKFKNYKFDHIHVCLSPQYIPKNHWHYFSMFINTYEHFHEKDAKIENKKFEHDFRYRRLGNEILH